MSVVELRAAPAPEPVDVVVEVIESLLARAKSGELRAFAAGGILTGGESIHPYAYDAGIPYAQLVGVMSMTRDRIARVALERMIDEEDEA